MSADSPSTPVCTPGRQARAAARTSEGPRPEWTVLSGAYARALPIYIYRHLVRPGKTGWARVRVGYASDLTETRAKVGYDPFYIKNRSFALDVQILVRSVWTLLTGSGAR
jgi:lipopolysaccharide/colanic/teichoic acid biosynthesis glycosyltransferase